MKKPGFRKKLLAFAGAALLALIVWTLWGNTALMVTNITVKAPREVSGLRIAHVSDLHNAEFGAGNRELLGLLAEQHGSRRLKVGPELSIIRKPRLVVAGHIIHRGNFHRLPHKAQGCVHVRMS